MGKFLEHYKKKRNCLTEKRYIRMDYATDYYFSVKEYLVFSFEAILIAVLISYYFYHTFLISLLFLPFYNKYFKIRRQMCIKKREKQMRLQFKDMLSSLNASLQAGYSVENAVIETYKDLQQVYEDDAIIMRELSTMIRSMRMNQQIEILMEEFGEKSGITEIKEFTEVFAVAKRSGGSLPNSIRDCAAVISEKMEVQEEIQVVITAKQFESRIMMVVPLLILAYLEYAAPDFICVLYNNMVGVIVMTSCLLLYMAAIFLSWKIVIIEV